MTIAGAVLALLSRPGRALAARPVAAAPGRAAPPDPVTLRVLADFLSRPVCAPGGPDPDEDVIVAYNLAVEAALRAIRRAAGGA